MRRPILLTSHCCGFRGLRVSSALSQRVQVVVLGADHGDGDPINAATVQQYLEGPRAKFAAAGHPCRSQFALPARCMELGLIRPEEIEDHRPGEF